MSRDPIGLMGGLNNQTYVKDPNGWVDPIGLNETYGFSSGELKGASDCAVFKQNCLETTGEYCHDSHRPAPIYDYGFCSAGMPTKSGAGYINLVDFNVSDAPDRAAKQSSKKIGAMCSFSYILNKDKKAIRVDEIEKFINAPKTIKTGTLGAKLGMFKLGAGGGILWLKDYSNMAIEVAVEGALKVPNRKK